mgnify:CR=1 FL=1
MENKGKGALSESRPANPHYGQMCDHLAREWIEGEDFFGWRCKHCNYNEYIDRRKTNENGRRG